MAVDGGEVDATIVRSPIVRPLRVDRNPLASLQADRVTLVEARDPRLPVELEHVVRVSLMGFGGGDLAVIHFG